MPNLQPLFAPRNIALIGASTQEGSVGHDVARNLIESDYSGDVFFVNPKASELLGRPCYPSINAVPTAVDLALIAVPAAIVPAVLREAGEALVKAAVIISAGFKETGSVGAALETEVQRIAAEFHVAVLGPNCLGFIAPRLFLNASFASSQPRDGSIAFFSQSGALMSALLDRIGTSLGFSEFVSIGNKAVLNESDFFAYAKLDEATRVIGCYTEGLVNAAHFIATSRALLTGSNPKPTIVLKSGRTQDGMHASSSHTGALAGSDRAYDALFRQAGVIRATDFQELLDLLIVCSKNPLPRGQRLAIVTNAGGLGVLSTDAAIAAGLTLASLTPATIERLRATLPSAASILNPIDILGDARAERYAGALSAVAEDPNVDLLLVLLTPQTMTEPEKTAEAIIRLRRSKPDLPIVTVFAGKTLVTPGVRSLEAGGLAVIDYPEAASSALAHFARVGSAAFSKTIPMREPEGIDIEAARELITAAESAGQCQLGEATSIAILSHFGFPFLESHVAHSAAEAAAHAAALGRPVALKIISPDIIHKSEVGGVRLAVAPETAGEAFTELLETVRRHAPEARLDGALIVEMAAPGGTEIILGLKHEPGLGPLFVVGLGGIYVETLADISLRFLPLTEDDLDSMLRELRAYPILAGTRGKAGIDLERLKDLMRRLASFAAAFPEVTELDLNPVLAFREADAFRILDARLTLRASQ